MPPRRSRRQVGRRSEIGSSVTSATTTGNARASSNTSKVTRTNKYFFLENGERYQRSDCQFSVQITMPKSDLSYRLSFLIDIQNLIVALYYYGMNHFCVWDTMPKLDLSYLILFSRSSRCSLKNIKSNKILTEFYRKVT